MARFVAEKYLEAAHHFPALYRITDTEENMLVDDGLERKEARDLCDGMNRMDRMDRDFNHPEVTEQ